jgi:Cdc6-like AAA superfamily ATPase
MDFNWSLCKVISVVGETGSGKTATCFSILDQITNKKKFTVDHPTPNILKLSNILNIPELSMDELCDCVVWIDEPQLIYPKSQKRNNDHLLMLCSLARQRDITLILSTSDTRWINRGMESYVDTWVIKNLDFELVKQGSIVKKIISQKYHNIMPKSFRMSKAEAILYCPSQINRPKKIKVPLPSYWSEQFSKPYKYSMESVTNLFKEPSL